MSFKAIIIAASSLLVQLWPSCHVGRNGGGHRQSLCCHRPLWNTLCVSPSVSGHLPLQNRFCNVYCALQRVLYITLQSEPKDLVNSLGSLQAGFPFVPWTFVQKQEDVEGTARPAGYTNEREATGTNKEHRCFLGGIHERLAGCEWLEDKSA